jgi:hypothetical protein
MEQLSPNNQDTNPNDLNNITNKNELFNSLLCELCSLWPIKPLTCNNCEKLFCKTCAKDKNENKIYPVCINCTDTKHILTFPSKPILAILSKAKFKCNFCKENQSYEDIIQHTTYCEKNPSRMVICNKCSIEVSLDKLTTHNCVEELLGEINNCKLKLDEYDKLTPFNYAEYSKLKNTLKYITLI